MDNLMLYALSKSLRSGKGNSDSSAEDAPVNVDSVVALTREEYLALPEWDSSTLYIVTYTDSDNTEHFELFAGNKIVEVCMV